jgi:S1-C subfamily serine protease
MPNPQVWQQIRELIRNQDIDVAIQMLESWLRGRTDDNSDARVSGWLDELVLHYQNFNRIAERVRKGLLGSEAEGVALSKLSGNILALVRIIERQDQMDPTTPPLLDGRSSNGEKFEKILGNKSQLQMIGWLRRGLECSTAVCRLVYGQTRASGFRISNDLIVTNHHVLPTSLIASKFMAQFFFEEQADGAIGDPLLVPLEASRFWTSQELDISIVAGKFERPDQNRAISIIRLSNSETPEIGDPVTIIQHPLGGPKQIALTANFVMDASERSIRYSTDTLPGSSGSPVFNDRWQAIAVHHAGGVLFENSSGKRKFANQGGSS